VYVVIGFGPLDSSSGPDLSCLSQFFLLLFFTTFSLFTPLFLLLAPLFTQNLFFDFTKNILFYVYCLITVLIILVYLHCCIAIFHHLMHILILVIYFNCLYF